MVRVRGQHVPQRGVVDHDVGVRAGGDRPLARVEAEHPRRGGRVHLDPPRERQFAVDHALVQQVHPVLDPRHPVRDLGEVAAAHLLLLLETERAVVGGHDAQVVGAQPAPQVRPVLLRPYRWRADVLRPLEVRQVQVVLGQVQVLGAGLGEDVPAVVAGLRHRGERLLGGQVDDVQRRAGDLGQPDGPRGGLPFQFGRPGPAVPPGVGVPAGQRLRDEHVDRDAVFRVHHDRRTAAGGPLHGLEDLAVGRVEHARIGHEHLEAGHALADQYVHLLERLLVDIGDDHVEPVVDAGLALGLGVPGVQRLAQRAALGLHGEVQQRGGAAPGGRAGPGLEVVGGERPAERHVQVGMHVDAAGDDVLAGGVDGLVDGAGEGIGAGRVEQCRHGLAVDQHVGR